MPENISAADFTRLRLQYGTAPEAEELPAAIEHVFDAGRMVDHYLVAPAPALLARKPLQALGTVGGVAFLPLAEGGWQVRFFPAGEGAAVVFSMPEEEFRRLLAQNGVILPGEPGFAPAPPKA